MALFVLSLCPFDISVGVGAFGHRTESDLFLFLLSYQLQYLVTTPLRPLRSFRILVAERSQSGCSVCLTEALLVIRYTPILHDNELADISLCNFPFLRTNTLFVPAYDTLILILYDMSEHVQSTTALS